MILNTDGGVYPKNPGEIGTWGFTDNNKVFENGRIKKTDGSLVTNNETEYVAILKALEYAIGNQEEKVTILSDSDMCVNVLSKKWGKKKGKWKPHKKYPYLRDLALKIDNLPIEVEYIWVPREENEEADALCEAAEQEPERLELLLTTHSKYAE